MTRHDRRGLPGDCEGGEVTLEDTIPSNAIADLVDAANRMGENFAHLQCAHADVGWVYILAGNGTLKIGSVRRSETFRRQGPLVALTNRLRHIQAMSSGPLSLLRLYTGGPVYEKELHRQFKQYRLHGEWFDWAAISRLEMTGCPACGLVVVQSDMDDAMQADLRMLRGEP